ncbi:MAG: presenilin family intramembrane aspartyl protease PSH [Candidatus Thermoplasmatota archaeon]
MHDETACNRHLVAPIVLMACFFLIIHGLGLLVIRPFQDVGVQPAFEEPNDPMNLVIIFTLLLATTGIILLIARFWKKKVIQIIILGAVGYTSFFILYPLLLFFFGETLDLIAFLLAVLITVSLLIVLYKYPEWYIIDICGVLVGAGAIAILGMSLTVFLVIILLIILALYDAISVYKTKHMIDLADTVMDLKLPVLLVVPKIWRYSLLQETKSLKEKLKENQERDAFFMGLGDVVMPGILVVSVYHSVEYALPVALSVIAGTLVGFAVLMIFVIKGKPQAGLPCLCGGAIFGYIVGSFLFFGELVGLSYVF